LIFYLEEQAQTNEVLRQTKQLLEGVRPAVDKCQPVEKPEDLPVASKALVLDLRSNERGKATDRLPESLRAAPGDKEMTIFAIVSVQEEKLDKFYQDGSPGYRQTAKIAVVRWPQKEPVGLYTLACDPPTLSFRARGEKALGDLDDAIVKWIQHPKGD
jgi:hypothetical protein